MPQQDPTCPKPTFARQAQSWPGLASGMASPPDHGASCRPRADDAGKGLGETGIRVDAVAPGP